MEDLDINNYSEQLNQVCDSCKKQIKCKEHSKICLAKKLVWNIAKVVYKQRKKKGEL